MPNVWMWVLVAFVMGYCGGAQGQETRPITIIEPKQQSEPAKSAAIDTERYQLGLYLGTLSVEDFNANLMVGLSLTYLIDANFIGQINYAQSDVGRSTFERREGFDFLTDEQRVLKYFNLIGGYKVFTARSFLGARFKFDSDLYVTGGLGRMNFAGEGNVAFALGASYRVVITDWAVVNVDFKDHFFKGADVFGDDDLKTSQNLEFSVGFNALF